MFQFLNFGVFWFKEKLKINLKSDQTSMDLNKPKPFFSQDETQWAVNIDSRAVICVIGRGFSIKI